MPVTLITESSDIDVDATGDDLLAPLLSESGDLNPYGRVLADFVNQIDVSPVFKDLSESDLEELCFVVEGRDLDDDTLALYGLRRGVRTKDNATDESFVDDNDVLYVMPPEVLESLIDPEDFVNSFSIYARQLLPESDMAEKVYKATAVNLADLLEGKIDEAGVENVKGGRGWWKRLIKSGAKGRRLVVAMGMAARAKGAIVYKKDGWKGGHNAYGSVAKKGGNSQDKAKYEKYAKANKAKTERNRRMYGKAAKGKLKGKVSAAKAPGGMERAKGKAKEFKGYTSASESVNESGHVAPNTKANRNPFEYGTPVSASMDESIVLAGAASAFNKNRTSTKVND